MRARIPLVFVLFLCLTAAVCPGEEGGVVTPPVTGTVTGLVTIEGEPAAGLSVSLSSGQTATTDASGRYTFIDVSAGAYTISISALPADATFPSTVKAAVITSAGQTIALDFAGTWVRTSAIMGSVTVDGGGLQGVGVSLGGMESGDGTTSADGAYAFTGLRQGMYTVGISGFPPNVAFQEISRSTSAAVGETANEDFAGAFIRDAGITVQVTVGGDAREGVPIDVSGPESRTGATTTVGQAIFPNLIRGIYSVGLTNPDPEGLSFEETMRTVDVSEGGSRTVTFDGTIVVQRPDITITPTSLSTTHTYGQSPCPQEIGTLTLTNAGSVATSFNVESGGLAVSAVPPSGMLEPGAGTLVKLNFTCDPNGVEGSITIKASLPNAERSYPVGVTVTVTQPVAEVRPSVGR